MWWLYYNRYSCLGTAVAAAHVAGAAGGAGGGGGAAVTEVSAGGGASDVARPGHSVMVIELSNITALPVTECHLHQHTLPLLPVPIVLLMWTL